MKRYFEVGYKIIQLTVFEQLRGIKKIIDTNICLTPCPLRIDGTKIGSNSCSDCQYYNGGNISGDRKYILCGNNTVTEEME